MGVFSTACSSIACYCSGNKCSCNHCYLIRTLYKENKPNWVKQQNYKQRRYSSTILSCIWIVPWKREGN
jgi:hypothetical protein